MFMLFLLTGMVSFSFAATPDWAACNYAYNITYYDSPSSAGTINGYSNGQTQQIQHNRVPCQDYELYSSAQASPSSGYAFSSWSSSSISLSSTSANPAGFSMGPGSGSITANYVLLPDILNLWSYNSNSSSGSSGSAPPSVMNNTDLSSASGFSTSEQCGVMNVFNDPYCLWVSSGGKINGNSYVSLMFIDNSSAAYPNYPHGNTTVTMTLELFNNNYANVTAMSVNFVPASGTPINLGNSFVENYGTHVWSAVVDLAGYVGHDAQASYLSQ